MTKRLVDDIQNLSAILLFAEYLAALGVHRVQVIPFHHHFGYLLELLRHALLRHDELVLHVVVILFPAAHLLDMLRIVRVVIDGGHCA